MLFWGFYIDPLYLVLFIVTLVISGASQLYIRSTFARWSQVANSAGLSGVQVGERLVSGPAFARHGGAGAGVTFKIVPGNLSDHFDPRTREVGLSQEVASRQSVASMAVTAHEVGHAQQHAEGTFAMKARSFLVPAVTFSPIVELPVHLPRAHLQPHRPVLDRHHRVRPDGRVHDPHAAGGDRRQPPRARHAPRVGHARGLAG